METKYFDNGFVGKKVDNANEAIMLHNAGMDIRAKNGCDFLWCDEDNEEPSVSKVASRIIECINDHGFVYAGFELENEKVVPIKSTQLNCDLFVGQTVYFLRQGEISHGEVLSIQLATDNKIANTIREQFHILRNYTESIDSVQSAINFINYVDCAEGIVNDNCVCIKTRGSSSIFLPIGKVFSTKEALIDNLVSNAK